MTGVALIPDGVTITTPGIVLLDTARIDPTTSNTCVGEEVPIPTLPFEAIASPLIELKPPPEVRGLMLNVLPYVYIANRVVPPTPSDGVKSPNVPPTSSV